MHTKLVEKQSMAINDKGSTQVRHHVVVFEDVVVAVAVFIGSAHLGDIHNYIAVYSYSNLVYCC